MGVDAAALAALLWIFTQEFLLLAALCILVFAVDELFVDALYFAGLFKRWVRQPPWRAGPTARDLPAANSDRFAIFIPAWDEAGVIGRMLSHLTATLVQGRYDIFVGVYPNDPATRSAAAAVHDRRIRIVTGERSGPT
ncbi:MAG: glycosyltransferase, partial [Pacificimonas sp.]|nr:glycosyltransferase [Pacificimonas sp.]